MKGVFTDGHEQIDVVAANEILGQVDDGSHERLFTVMVGRQLGNGTSQLGNLDLAPVLPLEAGEEHLALAGLQAVDHRRDRTLVVQVAEQDQLLVDKVRVRDGPRVLLVEVHLGQVELAAPLAVLHLGREPVLALLDRLLGEGHHDGVVVALALVLELDPVPEHVGEVLLRLGRGRGAQT